MLGSIEQANNAVQQAKHSLGTADPADTEKLAGCSRRSSRASA
jgi:hypothetical protein